MEPEIETSVSGAQQGIKKPPFLLVGLLLVVIAFTLYFYLQVRALEQNPDKVNQAKIAALVAKVEKLIDLPQGEVPSTATIADTKPLAGNPFFVNAKTGDEVLFYTAASKAFLYDPVKNLIVEVATINLGK
jgi:lipopolysaccharide export LptBFGC system permease protein LptF